MARIVVVILVYLVTASASAEVKRLKFPKVNAEDCGFYLGLEDQVRCAEGKPQSFYLTGYGYKFCQKFRTSKKGWGRKLFQWATETCKCLQQTFVENENQLRPCDSLEKVAYDSHPSCYEKGGFCGLDFLDRQRVFEVVGALDIAAEPKKSLAQAAVIRQKCEIGFATSVIHFVLWMIEVSRFLPADSRVSASFIVERIPLDSEISQAYVQEMTSIILVGEPTDKALSYSKKFLASYSATGFGATKASTVFENLARECRKEGIDSTICQDFKLGYALKSYDLDGVNNEKFAPGLVAAIKRAETASRKYSAMK